MKRILFLFLSLWLLSSVGAYAHIALRTRQIMTSDGLPNNTIRYIYQDSKGFIWLCTLNGLARYDGSSFLTFHSQDGDGSLPSLADNRVYKVKEDSNGFFWISSASDLYSCYDSQLGRFVDFTGDGQFRDNVSGIRFTANGNVWMWYRNQGLRRAVLQPDRTFRSVVYTKASGQLPDDRVNFVCEDASGTVWIGTQKGLASVDKNGKAAIADRTLRWESFVRYGAYAYLITREGAIYRLHGNKLERKAALPADTNVSGSGNTFLVKNEWYIMSGSTVYRYSFDTNTFTRASLPVVGKLMVDSKGDYWVYNHTGQVCYVKKNTGAMKVLNLIPSGRMGYIDYERYHIAHDRRGIIWISTYGNGLFAYHPDTDRLEHFTSSDDNSPITSDYLLYVAADRSGDVWVAADESGLSHIEVMSDGTQRIFPETSDRTDRSNTVRMVTRVKGASDVWLSTRAGGLYRYDEGMRLKERFMFPNSSVYAMAKDNQGKMWVGTRGEGLQVDGKWYRTVPGDASSLGENNIFDIHLDRKGRMWIATFGGGMNLAVPVEGGYKFRRFLNETDDLANVRSIREDARGMFWVATGNGLCIFHPDTLINTGRYHIFNRQNGTFDSNEIRCVYFCKNGTVAVGTSDNGLDICTPSADYASLERVHYGKKEGLVDDVVVALQEDDKGMLWVATSYGISRFEPATKAFRNYFFASRTQGNIYTENSSLRLDNGELVFGTNYGLTIVNPDHLTENDAPARTFFTGLYVNGMLMTPQVPDSPLERSITYTDQLTLKHFQNSITLQFSNFDYSDDTHSLYCYWLENYDTGWSSPVTANSVSYKNLAPGTYILHVKSCTSSGVWSDEDTQLKIVVAPPFWRTGWAFLIYLLLLAAALVVAYRIMRKIDSLRTRIQVEKQLTEHKLVFFTNVSHEFRTPLTLIQVATERILRYKNLPAELGTSLQTLEKGTQRMSRLINQILEFRKMQSGKLALALEEMDVMRFLKELSGQFAESIAQKRMHFQFKTATPSFRMFVDKEKLDKIVYNLLSNAFKYTPAGGTVTLEAEVQGDEPHRTLVIRVTDNGVGIPKEKQSELFKRFMQSNFSNDSIGIGLHLTHELVTVHKGKIEYAGNPGGGSIFTVTLPAEKDAYAPSDFLTANQALVTTEDNPMEQQASGSGAAGTVVPLNKHKILIIEDDHDVRQLLADEIGRYFEVETAEDGTSGFKKAVSCNPDLIVCDVLMPGMNGFEVTRKLKNSFDTSHIPVILLTALGSPEKQLEGIEAGADAYIPKPFDVKFLMARIFRLIEQREKLKEKYSQEPGMVHVAMYTTDKDKEFVRRLTAVIEANMERADFSIEEFAQIMKSSRTTFYNKVRGVTGYSPVEYLRIIRMKKAAELLLSKDEELTVAEVSYKVGFNDPLYFSKCFKAQFGISPSIYKKGGKPISEDA